MVKYSNQKNAKTEIRSLCYPNSLTKQKGKKWTYLRSGGGGGGGDDGHVWSFRVRKDLMLENLKGEEMEHCLDEAPGRRRYVRKHKQVAKITTS